MNNLPELIYVRTVPHTGTHFLLELLNYAVPGELMVEGINRGLTKNGDTIFIQDILRECIKGRLSFELMIQRILDVCNCNGVKYLGLFEHIVLPGTPGYAISDTWIRDFSNTGFPGYTVKTVMTLRSYRSVVLTILLMTINSPQERWVHLDWSRKGYEFMALHYDDSNYFYLPVDLLAKKDYYFRMEAVCKLFGFLNIHFFNNEIGNFVKEWKPVNSIKNKKSIHLKGNKEFEILMNMRDSQSDNLAWRHEEFDSEMCFYETHRGIQKMFEKYNYKARG